MEVSEIVLKVLSGVHTGAEMILHKEHSYTIGKDIGCSIILADALLAPVHGEITVEENSVLFTQKKGRVLIGGTLQVEKQIPIQPFQVITIGSTHLAIGPKEGNWKSISLPKLDNSLMYSVDPPLVKYQQDEKPKNKNRVLYLLAGLMATLMVVGGILYFFTDEEKTPVNQNIQKVTSMMRDQYPNLQIISKDKKIFVKGYLEKVKQLEGLKRQLEEFPIIFQIKTDQDIEENIRNILSSFPFGEKISINNVGKKKFEIAGTISSKRNLDTVIDTLNRTLDSDIELINTVEVKVPIPDIVINVKSVRTGIDSYITLKDGKKYREGDTVLKDFILKKIFLDKLVMEYKNNEFIYTLKLQ